MIRRSPLTFRMGLVVALVLVVATVAYARMGQPPRSALGGLQPLDRVAVLRLEPVDRQALLAEDEAAKKQGSAKPLRFASPVDLAVGPPTAGTWESLPDGGRVWRLRVHAPNATDLSFGFTRFRLAPGATLHIWSEDRDYYQGPYTAADVSHAGDFWTPVVPGEKAVIELYEPAGASSELLLGRVGRGYRDLFKVQGSGDQGSCNIDVICPEGDSWRDEIRSVAMISISGQYLCTGTLIMDVPRDFTPYLLTANHCEVRSTNAWTVVAYWNYESPTCGELGGGSLADNQIGTIFRAARQDNDLCLLELDADPDPSFNVYYAGWDARTSTAPQSTVTIHHPSGGEKALAFNNLPLTTGNSCIGSGGVNSHWWVDHYDLGTTEGGSSGSGLLDTATHLIVGYLSGGTASCSDTAGYDCYGKFSVGWDGSAADSRFKDWLDPQNTGTRYAAGSDPTAGISYVGHDDTDTCSSGHGNDNGVWEPGETIQITVDLVASGSFTNVSGTLTSQTSGVTVTHGSATWPNLSPGVTTTSNSPGFTIQLGTGVACYSTVQLTLQVTAAEGGPYTFTITNPVGAPLTPDVPVTIPDLGTATSTLSVDQNVTLTDVNVRVQITHSYVHDLIVTLVSPAGTQVTLLNRAGCGDDNMDVTFDDSSTVNLQNYCAGTDPWYSGTAHPYQALSAFNGQSTAGTWSLIVTDNQAGDSGSIDDWELITTPALSGTCQTCSGGPVGDYVYLVGGISHAPGAANTNWRSKLAVLNRSGSSAQVTLDYVRTSKKSAQTVTLANGQLTAWDDVAVTLFGVSGSSSGAIKITSTQPLIVGARTYNQGTSGTYGQSLPGVTEADALASGQTGVISQLSKNSDFRTNIGFVNLGTSTCQVRITLRNTSGTAVGSQTTVDVSAGSWKQANDIFQSAGAGTQNNAYATVEVLTSGCTVWGYGSVVDMNTGDPTTVPLVVQ